MSRNARLCGKIIFFLAFYLFFGTHNAFAHAEIIRAEPADGAELAESPATMTLWFNETIVEHFSSVQVLDLQNQSVSGVTIQADPAERDLLYVMLPTLAPGGYTVFWKVLSDSDGHLSQGFTTLTIGPDAVSRHSAAMPAGAETPVPVEALLRWLNYLLLTSLIGALAMLRWVVASVRTQSSPGAILAQHQLRRRVRWLAVGCAAGAFLLGFGILGWQVTRTQVDTTVGAGVSTQLWFLLSQTQWGIFWLVRQGLLLFLTVALWVLATLPKEPDALWPWLLIYGRAVDLAIVQALTGHAGSASHAWVLVLGAATVHLLAAGVWMGGLLTLFLIFWPTRDRIQSLSPGWRPIVWPAFTRAAVVSVGLLFASGLYRMGQQVASVDALLTTRYGQLLISKGLLVVVVGICGLANALVVHPAFTASLRRRLSGRIVERLTEPDGRQPLLPARFPRLIALEVAGGLLILGVAALLTATAPPNSVNYTIAPADIKPVLGQRVDDLIITLAAKPNRIGRNLFTVRSVSTVPESANVARIELSFTNLVEEGVAREPINVSAEEVEAGLYQASGNYLTQAGAWQIDVTVQRYGLADSIAHFRWTVPPVGEIQPVLLSKAPWHDLLTWLAAMAVVVIAAVIVIWLLMNPRFRRSSGRRRERWSF